MPKHEAAPHSSNGATASRPPDGAFRSFALPARAAEVVSSNIVGYEKITLTPGLNMIGNQFFGVGTGAFQNINEMFRDDSQLVAGSGDDSADTILVWDGSGYSDVFYFDNYGAINEWYNVEDIDNVATDVLDAGTGFWFKHFGNATVQATFAGEVPTNAACSVTIKSGLNMIANPYPMAICPNGEYFEVIGAVSGTGDDEADTILVWDGSGYSDVYYLDNYGAVDEWYNVEDIDNAVTDAILKPAMGFWYKHKGTGGTLTFKRPFNINQ